MALIEFKNWITLFYTSRELIWYKTCHYENIYVNVLD